jgi:5-formyltetrahydrofolate cyclo-ligase
LDKDTKNTLRKYYREARKNVAGKENPSKIVCGYIKSLEVYQKSSCPIFYWTCKNEVSLFELCKEKQGKNEKFGLPRCVDKDGNMEIFEANLYEMSPDCNNILSPNPQNIILPQNIDCIFVPAVAFDIFGNRLGQGGGYYDRYLKKCENAVKIGICFSVQISQNPLPDSEHDERVSMIISEKGILKV